jgi:predicted ATPase/transcriptional regulator with XRE-family HTH domain
LELPVSFGLWLKERRKQLGLTQVDLAGCVGCSTITIRKIEMEERRPSRQIAELLANCLEIAPADRPTFLKVARAELRVDRLPQHIERSTINPASPSRAPSPSSHLPTPSIPLIGREHELAAIRQRLQDPHCRLLSLVGPGGIGKTRLALATASSPLQGFDDGVFFVALAPISNSEFIVPTLADAIGFSFYDATDPRVQLFTYLRQKRMLLILDNLEHLLDGVDLLADLLQQTPTIKLLITSRERLNLRGEWVFEVQGLPVPPSNASEPLEGYSATRLFLQSAQRALVGFEVPPAEQPAVARICRLMEGLPLGIELAAAWVRVLSCQEIAQEIERNLDFLTASARDVPARHHSIRAVFDHSWKLLSAEEQRVLRQLSVFRGGFQRETATQVAEASLPELAGLVDKSLVSLTAGGRYHLHELLRQFSAAKLDATPAEQAATLARHSDYFLGFLQEREAGLTGKAQKTTLDEIQAEIENVRAAWNWAVRQGQVEAIDRAMDSLYHFYLRRGHYQEGEDAFRRAVEHLQQTPELCSPRPEEMLFGKLFMKALARQGAFCRELGHYDLASELLQNSLGLARRWAVQAEVAFSLNLLGDIVWEQGDYLAAESLYLESLAISQAVGDQFSMSEALWRLGWLNATTKGSYPTAQSYLQQSLDLLRETGNQAGIALVLDKLGYVTFHLGEYPESEQYYGESLALFKEIGDRLGTAMAVGGLGLVAWGYGGTRLNEAKRFFEESLDICREIGHQSHIQIRLSLLGHVSNSLGSYEEAHRYFQEAWDLAKQLGKKAEVWWIVAGLGEAALGLGNFPEARHYLLEALETPRIPIALEALVNWAALLKKEADGSSAAVVLPTTDVAANDDTSSGHPVVGVAANQASPAHHEQKQQAVEILSLALNHPATVQRYKEKAVRLLAELEAELPPEVVGAAREQGQAETVGEVVAKIVGK